MQREDIADMQVQLLAPPAAVDDVADLAEALAGTPWSVRRGRGPGTRPALEIWEADSVADIIVATPIASQTLRGARRTRGGGPALSLAWGRLPAGPHVLSVTFSGGWLPRRTVPAEVIDAGGLAWFALAAGRFAAVSVACRGGRERLSVRAVRPGWTKRGAGADH
jgi:hypothetical protein